MVQLNSNYCIKHKIIIHFYSTLNGAGIEIPLCTGKEWFSMCLWHLCRSGHRRWASSVQYLIQNVLTALFKQVIIAGPFYCFPPFQYLHWQGSDWKKWSVWCCRTDPPVKRFAGTFHISRANPTPWVKLTKLWSRENGKASSKCIIFYPTVQCSGTRKWLDEFILQV